MDITIEPGRYVVAVSGGVDSVALLHMLHSQSERDGLKLLVAHLDHGIRGDSRVDRLLVQALAKSYGLPFVYHKINLGTGVSEAEARKARYDFLRHVRRSSASRGIITAHHQDDLLETAAINIIRGTGRKGLSSLKSSEDIVRPLLHISKQDLVDYARAKSLNWREDSTNQDRYYLRNRIRHDVLTRLNPDNRRKLLAHIQNLHNLNEQIDHEIINYLHLQPATDKLDRHWFIMLPHAVAREVLATWLRKHGVRDFDKKMLERLVVFAKTYASGKKTDVKKGWSISVNDKVLALEVRDR